VKTTAIWQQARAFLSPRQEPSEPKAVSAVLRAMGNLDLGHFQVSFANGAGSGFSWVDIGVRSRYGQLLR
jgi:hypothetical protein